MQVVGYEPGTPTAPAALELATDGTVSTLELTRGKTLDYGLGERHCAGATDGTDHHACARPTAPYCDIHSTTWACATCRGNCGMPLETCHEEHVVYLAAFEPATFKVGVTRSWRFERRLAEQGARRGVQIKTVENGRIARQIEADLAAEVPDRIPVEWKIDGLAQTLDHAAWESVIESHTIEEAVEFDWGLDLSTRPITATMAAGTVRGTRGRVLVLERGESTYAIDLRDLVGFELQDDAAESERQASLGAFDRR
ncbi:DUF2797 domain-containing protein [Halodesulfurarchaeum sp. HSR-GB]|uniref:DUF2797 domain-containing protein n=1 Tax=Halodesulfurarchaeum sp. HSR-GB TaxID=3074077 RepID=UPI00285EE09F|nr:DUF2797 domain-containing protein [Halodesulfurarchaeum sp. HSR-GB]MDR5657041.1 DUF2797 domain-containing protein [Halodesulfurarchaeum sp. HSR-GB]